MASLKPAAPVRASRSGRPIMALLDLCGRRWTLRLLWELREKPRRFRELQEACDGASPTIVNRRLTELRDAGFVSVVAGGYRATPLGESLGRAILPLTKVADRWHMHTLTKKR